MPRFRIVLHADALEWLKDDVWVEGGIFTTVHVSAPDSETATRRARIELAEDCARQPFVRGLGGEPLRITIEETTEVSFLSGRLTRPGFVFYDARDYDDADGSPDPD